MLISQYETLSIVVSEEPWDLLQPYECDDNGNKSHVFPMKKLEKAKIHL